MMSLVKIQPAALLGKATINHTRYKEECERWDKCKKLCIYPQTKQEDELEEICRECEMGKFVCDICNKYNEICNFENSQIKKLLIKKAVLEEKVGMLESRLSEKAE